MKRDTAIESLLAFDLLTSTLTEVDKTCRYELLRDAIGVDPQRGPGYGYVTTARARFERERDCVLEAVPNIGIRRLPSRDVINRGGRDLAHIRRSVKRGMRRMVTLVPVEQHGDLSNDERKVFHAHLSHLGVLGMMTRPTATKKIGAAAENARRSIPAEQALRLFITEKRPADETVLQ
jgi:hypothetical protein